MNDLNQVMIEGKLVRNPEITWLKDSDKAVCKFTIAVNKRYRDRTKNEWIVDTSYFLVETWRSVAQQCAKWLEKGRGVRVIGELKQSRWVDDTNAGKRRESVYIIAEHVEFQAIKKPSQEPEIIKGIQEDERVDTTEANDILNKQAIESPAQTDDEEFSEDNR